MDSVVEWSATRDAFASAAKRSREMLARRDVAQQWDHPSCCAGMTLGGLAGHLLGVARSFERRCDTSASPDAVIIDPALTYHTVRLEQPNDLIDPVFALVRENAQRVAERGHAAVVTGFDEAVARLNDRLAHDDGERLVALPDPTTATTLQHYTATRIVELVVHTDDLAESAGAPIDPPGERVAGIVIGFLSRAVHARLGDGEFIRALAGRRPSNLLRAL